MECPWAQIMGSHWLGRWFGHQPSHNTVGSARPVNRNCTRHRVGGRAVPPLPPTRRTPWAEGAFWIPTPQAGGCPQ